MLPAIAVQDLSRFYTVHEQSPGFWGAVRGLVHRTTRLVRAVDGISFSVASGELVAFLGPNGAGKTTTLKVLAGLLYATSGRVEVLGETPHKRSKVFLQQISFVMGQKSQLLWDLPPSETFELQQALYEIPQVSYVEQLDELVEVLELRPLLHKPVRTLSLGERMRCEIAAALLHRPKVLFLDEPTLGLDPLGQASIRRFIKAYNARSGATILMTSHYMEDVLAVCRRIIVINRGKLIHDGDLDRVLTRVAPQRRIRLILQDRMLQDGLGRFGTIESADGERVVLRVARGEVAAAAATIVREYALRDLAIEEPPVEEIVQALYGGAVDGSGR